MDAELEAGEAAPQGTFGTFTGRGARKRPGRRPAETPDAALGAEALVTTIRGKFPFISGAFNAVDVEGGRIELEWLGRVQFAKRDLQVVHCLETGRRPYNGAFVTDLMICGGTDALGICTWGRRRWNIESDFNVEKHGGFGLEHTFCTSDRQAANMHLLMLLAHLLWQVVFLGVLRRLYAGCRKLAQKKLAQLIQRVLHTRGPPSTGRQFQLRFSTG